MRIKIKIIGDDQEKIMVQLHQVVPAAAPQKVSLAKRLPGLAHSFEKYTQLFHRPKDSSLADEPAAETASQVRRIPVTEATPKTFEIRITIPRLPTRQKVTQKLSSISRGTLSKLGIISAVIIILSSANHLNVKHSTGDKTTKVAPPAQGLVKGTPKYATVLPAGKNIRALGGWTRVSPPNRDPVFAYVDKIGGVQIDVSEQPLPANFRNETDKHVTQLAQEFGANEKLTAGGTTAYLGTSAKGPQSVILSKNDLLILVKSTSPIPNDQWTAYLASLQ